MDVNISKLQKELIANGIEFGGINANGVVWDIDGVTEIQNRLDVSAVIAAHDSAPEPESNEQVFNKPIRTPAIYVEDIFVSSRKIKDDPDEAFAEAVAESEKPHGEAKSLDLITRSQTKMIKELRRQIVELEKRVKKLEK